MTIALPTEYTFGHVVCRIIHAVADTAADPDALPEARPAAGKVRFRPDQSVRKTLTDYSAFALNETVEADLDATGRIVDAQGVDGIWLPTGDWNVSFVLTGGTLPDFKTTVTAAHTLVAPLDLVTAAPYTPPIGVTVTTIIAPAGAALGQVLAWGAGGLEWAPQTGGVTSVNGQTGAVVIEAATGNARVQVGTLTLPNTPSAGDSVTVLATPSTIIPAGVTWDTGGAPTVSGRLLISLVWSGTDWVGTYGLPFAAAPDTTAPTWTATLTTGSPTSTSVVVAASALATDAVGVTGYEMSTNSGSTWAAITPSGLNFTISGLTASTAYPAPQFRAKDAAGNRSTALTAQAFTTAAPPSDTTAPIAGSLASSVITATGFTLTVTGASDAVGLNATPYAFSTDNGATWTAYQSASALAVSGKAASTAYTCQHRVRDAAGNVSTGTAISVTTSAAVIPAGAYDDAVIADSPLYYLPLDDAVGSSTARNLGSGAATWTATGVTFGAAALGDGTSSADFDGIASKVSGGSAIPALSAGSVAVLVQRDTLSGSAFGGDIIGSNISDFLMTFYSDKLIVMRSGTGIGGSGFVDASGPIVVGQRALVEFTWDASGWVSYVNGIQFATGADSFSGITSAVWTLGYAEKAYFDGRLAGAAIFSTKQTSARALARAQAAGLA